MKRKKVPNWAKSISKHSPKIMLGLGITGTVTAAVMCIEATPKAITLLNEAEEERGSQLNTSDKIKTTWKCYAPAVIVEILSISCIVFSQFQNDKRSTALAAAYTISEARLKEYQKKVLDTIGEKKEQSIRDDIAKDRIEANPVKSQEVVLTGTGKTLCYDTLSGRYFESDIDKVKKAENILNRMLLEDMEASLNDFYYEINLDSTKIGDYLGWSVNDGMVNMNFSSQLSKDGTPCLVIDYSPAPRYDYQKY